MSWQRSLEAAVRALKKEEELLERDLEAVRSRIDELSALAKARGPRTRAARKGVRKNNRLSAEGRDAISQAAKKRWAKYRAQKRKQRS